MTMLGVGTEHGHAPYPCWNTVNWQEGELPAWGGGVREGNWWAPAECDVSILRPNWFWSPGSDARILSLESLMEIYYMSVGRSANLLLNITPDDHGAIPDAQMKRIAEFGDDIRARFGKPLASTSGALKETTGSLAVSLDGKKTVDHVRLREDIRGGERARKFKVLGRKPNGIWSTLVSGSQIGASQIIPFAPIEVTELKLEMLESVAPVSVLEFSAFLVARPVPALAYREGSRVAMRAPKIERSLDGMFSLDCPSPEWDTRYTLDGSEPDSTSPRYHEPQRCPGGGIIKARYFDRDDKSADSGPVLVHRMGLPASCVKVLRASSQDVDGPSAAAFDANIKTMWHTAWRPAKVNFPHEIVLDLGVDRHVAGLAFLPRQDAVGNQAASVRIFVGTGAEVFPDNPQFAGTFGDYKTDPQGWHEVLMPAVATGRYVKLVFTAAADNGPHLAAAEMEILVNEIPFRGEVAGALAGGAAKATRSPVERTSAGTLEQDFRQPPMAARPSCYWWWLNNLVDKPGITRDLEEFRAKGLGGVMLVYSGNWGGAAPPQRGPTLLSPAWRELYRHALQEAARLGME
ncbi:MAG: discoidin domain-containing protein, partial [bacterium]